MATVGTLIVKVGADTGEAESKLAGLGRKLTRTLTPVAGAAAAAGKLMFDDWHNGLEAVRVGTGATGDELDGLLGTVKKVAGSVPTSFGVAGQAVADLNTRLGLTGDELEDRSRQFVELSRITKTDLGENVAAITRLFGDWSIATEDQGATLDKLFRLSQATGVSVSDLSRNMVQFGSPMRQLGLDFDFGAAMFAKFEKEGVAVETLMPGLRFGLKVLSGATPKVTKELKAMGVALDDPQKALAQVFKLIKDAPSNLEANALAFKVFGVRAGPDMAAAIREGRFELDDLMEAVSKGTDTIGAAAQDTLTLGDRFKMLKNRVVGAAGPYGEFVAIVGGGLAAVGPALLGFSMMAPTLGKLAKATRIAAAAQWLLNAALLANPIVLVIAALVALGLAFVLLWQKSETFRRIVTGAWEKLQAVAAAVFGWLKEHWKLLFVVLLAVATGGLGLLVLLVVRKWGAIRAATLAAWNAVKGVVVGAWNAIKGAVSGGVNAAVAFVRSLPGRAVSALASLPGGVAGVARMAWRMFLDATRVRVLSLLALVRGLPGRVVNALGDLGGLLYGAGVALVQGLMNGILSKLGELYDRVNSIAGGIASVVRGVLGIGSPSRVFFELGKWTMEGFLRGLDSRMGEARAVVGEVSPTVRANVEAGANSGTLAASPLHVEHLTVNDPVDVELLAARVSQRLAFR